MKESSNDSLSARLKELPGGSFLNLRSVPPFAVGATLAVLATWLMAGLPAKWLMALAAALLYLSYRTYLVYVGRIEDGQRHAREMADLHLATIEALALAIDAKDRTSHSHLRRVQLYATSVARVDGDVRERRPGRQDRRAAARHRQAGRPRTHPVEAGSAHTRGVPEDPRPSESRRRHRQLRPLPVSGSAADSEPSRKVGRQGLSRWAQGSGDSTGRADSVRRGLLRRADGRSAVSQGDVVRRRCRAPAPRGRPRAGSRCRDHLPRAAAGAPE